MDNKKIFPCYSVKLRDKLLSEGCKYEVVGINENTMRKFYCFYLSEKVKKILKEWNE